jgi:hypothetical protein
MTCKNNNNSELNNYYKKYCNILSKVIKEAKRLKYDNKIQNSSNKNKTIWDIVKVESNKVPNNEKICTLKANGKLIRETQAIAEIFNDYLSVAENKSENKKQNNTNINNLTDITPIQYLLKTFKIPFPKIKLKSLSTKEVGNIIKSLKPKNSYGYDEISTKLLRMSSSFIISPLSRICSSSLSQGICPDRLKYSEIKPLFK